MKNLDPEEQGYHELPFRLEEGEELHLRLFVDRSIVEVFANERQCLEKEKEKGPSHFVVYNENPKIKPDLPKGRGGAFAFAIAGAILHSSKVGYLSPDGGDELGAFGDDGGEVFD